MIDLDKVRNALPLPLLLERLGHKESAKKQAKCPLHEDKNPSFSIYYRDRWKWKCHAGCGQGDEVDFLKKLLNLPDDGEAIRRYADLAGVSDEPTAGPAAEAEKIFNAPAVVDTQQPKPEPLPPGKIDKLTEGTGHQLVEWRGFSEQFVRWLNENGVLGLFTNADGIKHIAFPVPGGVHYRKEDGSWRFSTGASPDLFVLGEIKEGAHVHCFESQWDALTYADSQSQFENIVATRGAGNVKLLTDRLQGHSGTLYLWPQNDEAGQKWANEIRAALPPQQIKVAKIPSRYKNLVDGPPVKDLNDWRKHGGTDGDIWQAFIDAKDFTVEAAPVEKPKRAPRKKKDLPVEQPATVTAPVLAESPPAVQKCDAALESTGSSSTPVMEHSSDGDTNLCEESAFTSVKESTGASDVTSSGLSVKSANASLSETLDKLVEFLSRYITFTMEEQPEAIALWIAHTWVFQSFTFTPYLNIRSPEKRCGKSRVLQCLKLLVAVPRKSSGISAPALRRVIDLDHPTLLLDEVDSYFNSDKPTETAETLRGALNDGFEAGAVYTCCDGPQNAIRDFRIFCPKAFAGIGKHLPDTVLDRSLEIRLVRQTDEKKAAKFRSMDVAVEAQSIRDELEAWSHGAADALVAARPLIPEQLNDRQQDMFEPLLAISELAGGEWTDLGRNALIALSATHEDQSLGVQLLASVREAFAFANKSKMTTLELLERLINQESADAPWPTFWENDVKKGNTKTPARRIAKMLKEYEIEPSTLRLGNDTAKGYYKQDFEDAWKRYLEPVKGMATMELGI